MRRSMVALRSLGRWWLNYRNRGNTIVVDYEYRGVILLAKEVDDRSSIDGCFFRRSRVA